MSDDHALAAADVAAMPAVARVASPWPLRLGMAGVVLLGSATFYGLNSARTAPGAGLPTRELAPMSSAQLPPAPLLTPAAPPPLVMPPPIMPTAVPVSIVIPPATTTATALPVRSPAPAVIVDLSVSEKAGPNAVTVAKETAAAPDKLSSNDAFAARVARTAPETVGTDRLTSTDLVVPQGTVIVAVLETAINSDLPGLVRAVVTRDVRGFDGSKVLVPRGSRLIGQYSNGVALGQSRAFVIWTRLLRSDGVSVQLGSAATDSLGTAGLSGKVNNHFLRRFGAATLLSVITSGLDYLVATASTGSSVSVGSPTQATQLAGIALQREIDIPPTIKVAQGTPVRVFVSHDLDFGATRVVAP